MLNRSMMLGQRLLVAGVSWVVYGATVAQAGSWYCSPSDLFPTSNGVYDEQAKAVNQVDAEAPGNTKTLEAFKADLMLAWSNNLGGVIGFEHGRGKTDHLYSLALSTGGHAANWLWPEDDSDYPGPTRLWYGKDYVPDSVPYANDGNGQYIEIHTGPGQVVDFYNAYYDLGTPISGYLLQWDSGLTQLVERVGTSGMMGTHQANHYGNGSGQHTYLYISSRVDITELGITALSKSDAAQKLSVIAHFSDGTALTNSDDIAMGAGTDDTFFYFEAPPGTVIVGLEWLSDQQRPQFDDLAFLNPGPLPPAINNKPGVIVRYDGAAATLGGTLLATNWSPAEVWVFWGLADGGTNMANWGVTNYLGLNTARLPVRYLTEVAIPASYGPYYYRYCASNATGLGWAPATTMFMCDHGTVFVTR